MAAASSASSASLSRRLTTQDASFLYNESKSGPTHVGALYFFEGEISFAKLAAHLESRLHLVPRYRQRLLPDPINLSHAIWHDDPTFDLANHVKRHRLTDGASEHAAVGALIRALERPLNRERPMWEMHLFEGVPGRSVVLWKIHHCLVDGVSTIELSTVLMDFRANAPAPPPPATPWKAEPIPNRLDLLLDAARDQMQTSMRVAERARNFLIRPRAAADHLRDLSHAARTLAQLSEPIAPAPWNAGLVTRRRHLAWSAYSFAEFRAIRGILGGTVNDVVLAILSEGAARYLAYHQIDPKGYKLRLGCPVNVRHEDEHAALGNRVSMMFPELSAVPMPPLERMAAVVAETERIKAAREPQLLELLLRDFESVPPLLQAASAGTLASILDLASSASASLQPGPVRPFGGMPATGINFIATNVPGVQVPQFMAGHQLLTNIGLIPLAGNLGYGVAIISYNQQLFFGLMAEPRLMPDVDRMKELVDASFEELKQAALAKEKGKRPAKAKPTSKGQSEAQSP